MAAIPKEVQELFEKAGAVVFATASCDAQPNACVVGMKRVIDDETLYLSDQFFSKTLANIRENARVSIVFWEGHDAYQIHGTARYVSDGEEFELQRAWADGRFAQMGVPIKAKGGCFVHVDAVYVTASGPHAGERIA